MRRRVTRAKLHDIHVVVPGLGQLERELPPVNKTIELEMSIDSSFPTILFVKLKKGPELSVPLANVQVMFLAPEEPETKEASKK